MDIITATMSKIRSKSHAEHNEKVCIYLDTPKLYGDWVVTTSFYCALHYLQYKLFPTKVKLRSGLMLPCIDFEEYHHRMTTEFGKIGMHNRMLQIVESKCSLDISVNYSKLLDMSKNSRYSEYKLSDDYIDEAKTRLAEIKKYVTPPAKPSAKK
jgi:hypothetical protein